jgi:hypothetical protein
MTEPCSLKLEKCQFTHVGRSKDTSDLRFVLDDYQINFNPN